MSGARPPAAPGRRRDRARGRRDAVARVAGRHRVRLDGPADADRPRRHERRHQQPDRGARARAAVHRAARGPGQPHRRIGQPAAAGAAGANCARAPTKASCTPTRSSCCTCPAGPDARAVAISIPRDSFVTLADGSGKHKINSAYGRATDDAKAALEAQGVTGPELDRRSRDAGRRALVATVEKFTRLPDRPLRGDQPRRFRRDDRGDRRRAGVPQAARARGPVRGRPARGPADGQRRRRARLRPAAPRPRGRRPGPHRPPAGVPRRLGEPDAVDRDAVRPGRGPPARRRRHPERRARPRVGPRPAHHPVRPDVRRRHPVRHHPDRQPRHSRRRWTGSPCRSTRTRSAPSSATRSPRPTPRLRRRAAAPTSPTPHRGADRVADRGLRRRVTSAAATSGISAAGVTCVD